MSKYIILLFACLSFTCCKCRELVVGNDSKHVEKVMQHDTLVIRDSVYTTHEQFVHSRGDTVYIEHYIYKYKEKESKGTFRLDTIINIVDTVTVYEMTSGQQSRNVSPTWGVVILLFAFVLALVYIVKKKS